MGLRKLGFEDNTIDIKEKVGQKTEGFFVNAREVVIPGRQDPGVIVTLATPKGNIEFWASTSIRMLVPQMVEGHYYVLTFLGEQKNPKTGRKFAAFEVAEDEDKSLAPAKAK